jgi:hypothetical protein
VNDQLADLRVMATEYIDWFPGFLKCELVDRNGELHTFVEKIPVMCGADSQHGKDGLYPVEITFRVLVVNEIINGDEPDYLISTAEPYDIKSEGGLHEFEVKKEQLIF